MNNPTIEIVKASTSFQKRIGINRQLFEIVMTKAESLVNRICGDNELVYFCSEDHSNYEIRLVFNVMGFDENRLRLACKELFELFQQCQQSADNFNDSCILQDLDDVNDMQDSPVALEACGNTLALPSFPSTQSPLLSPMSSSFSGRFPSTHSPLPSPMSSSFSGRFPITRSPVPSLMSSSFSGQCPITRSSVGSPTFSSFSGRFPSTRSPVPPMSSSFSGRLSPRANELRHSGDAEMVCTPHGIQIHIFHGDLVKQKTEAVIVVTNSKLQCSTWPGKAVLAAIGSRHQDDCSSILKTHGQLKPCQVLHTDAGNLWPNILYIIHAVQPRSEDLNEPQKQHSLLEDLCFSCLQYANTKLKVKSISTPFVVTGEFIV